MTTPVSLYVGTAGWFGEDLGETFVHPNSHSGMYLEAREVRALLHPTHPRAQPQ